MKKIIITLTLITIIYSYVFSQSAPIQNQISIYTNTVDWQALNSGTSGWNTASLVSAGSGIPLAQFIDDGAVDSLNHQYFLRTIINIDCSCNGFSVDSIYIRFAGDDIATLFWNGAIMISDEVLPYNNNLLSCNIQNFGVISQSNPQFVTCQDTVLFLVTNVCQNVSGLCAEIHLFDFTEISTTDKLSINTCDTCEALTIDGGLIVDVDGTNTGTIANTVKFGECTTGEAIGSKRNTGGNQWGLDFYTNFINRMAITNTGDVGIGTTSPSDKLDVDGTARVRSLPTNNTNDKVVFADATTGQLHALNPGTPTQYLAGNGTWQNLPAAGNTTNTCGTPSMIPRLAGTNTYGCSQIFDNLTNVGVGTTAPTDKLDVNGTARVRSLPAKAINDRLVFANANGQLRSLAASGLTTQYLSGNGTWVNLPTASGNTTNTCSTINFVPKLTGVHTYGCSQIFDNGTNVGIGTITPLAKLHTVTTTGNICNFNNFNFPTSSSGIGSHNFANNNSISIGTTGMVSGSSATTSKIGVWGVANANSCSGNNVGVYGQVTNSGPFCGTHFAGYFAGQTMMGGPVLVISDSTLKTRVEDIRDAMDIINALRPRTYDFDASVSSRFALTDKHQYGFISQEVERVLPDVVQTVQGPATINEDGRVVENRTTYKAMNYDALISILVKGMQEQEARINELEAMITSCCERSSEARMAAPSDMKIIDVKITDKNAIVLNQNVPNPFAESTSISYYIPETFSRAQMIFTNLQGQIIKAIEIKEMGKGQLNVFADDLSSGQYTYSIVVDGKIIDTKRMIKQ